MKRSVAPGELDGARPRGGPQSSAAAVTADYKKSILAEADAAQEPGAIGALLRREGPYSSHLTHWRQQRDLGLAVKRRGPKPKYDPLAEEAGKLKLHNGQLLQSLARAELIIDVQRKSRCCWEFRWRR